jgi:vacuolar-type H+-ATPase subunit F/Vma7
MKPCAFLGDEVSAAGFRLAGVEAHVPRSEQVPGLFRRLLNECGLVLITAGIAEEVPEDLLRPALVAGRPPVLVIPDVRWQTEPPDLGALLRRQLGMVE